MSTTENPGCVWAMTDVDRYFMWRPIKGKFEAGKTWLPWGTEPFVPLVYETLK